jgi:hypothetical protein
MDNFFLIVQKHRKIIKKWSPGHAYTRICARIEKVGPICPVEETIMEEYSEQYKAKCIKRLKEWGAPMEGWYCIQMYDVADEDDSPDDVALAVCELCDCSSVRYVHVMQNHDYFEDVKVGCICAGIMEGDIFAAKARDNELKNRARRKRNFPNRKWYRTINGNLRISYRGQSIYINKDRNGNYYGVRCGNLSVWMYKGHPIDNFLSAVYAAFELADPIGR